MNSSTTTSTTTTTTTTTTPTTTTPTTTPTTTTPTTPTTTNYCTGECVRKAILRGVKAGANICTCFATKKASSASTSASSSSSASASASSSASASASTERKNPFRIASEEEMNMNEEALALLNEIFQAHNNAELNNQLATLLNKNFKKADSSEKLKRFMDLLTNMIDRSNCLKMQLKLKQKKRSPSFKNSYNITLNKFLGIVATDSILLHLLPLNEQLQFLSSKVPIVRKRVDFVNAAFADNEIGSDGFLLHTEGPPQKGGGRTVFETPKDLLDALSACLESSVTWDDVIDKSMLLLSQTWISTTDKQLGEIEFEISNPNRTLYMVLKIRFPGTDYWVQSDSPRLRHILCDGNPPRKTKGTVLSESNKDFALLYPYYAEFLKLVKTTIFQIIKNSHVNPNCPYTIISCCRTSRVCNGNTLSLKYGHSARHSNTKSLICGDCNMDLCLGGCGRIFHGETPCDVSFDEASAALINSTTKSCPNNSCGVHISKTEGCNHMTCRNCRTEFCWSCGEELPRDSHGHYSTAMHFSDERFGVGRVGGCSQFNR